MAYELRLSGNTTTFETEQEAVAAARDALQADPDAEPEIIDLATGRAASPAASKSWREELTRKIGL